jgi:hypothetical protein
MTDDLNKAVAREAIWGGAEAEHETEKGRWKASFVFLSSISIVAICAG